MSRQYDVRVCAKIELIVRVPAENVREAAHEAALRALNSLEGLGQRPNIVDQEILFTRATLITENAA
jgi:hypothetical protein